MGTDGSNVEIRVLVTNREKNRGPFDDFYEGVKDKRARAVIQARLVRLRLGNPGDWKAVGDGVFEIRINFGPGFRIYYSKIENKIVLLLTGGEKKSQEQDIIEARQLWKEAKDELEVQLQERTRDLFEGSSGS